MTDKNTKGGYGFDDRSRRLNAHSEQTAPPIIHKLGPGFPTLDLPCVKHASEHGNETAGALLITLVAASRAKFEACKYGPSPRGRSMER